MIRLKNWHETIVSKGTQIVLVVVAAKALRAFHLKVSGVSDGDVLSTEPVAHVATRALAPKPATNYQPHQQNIILGVVGIIIFSIGGFIPFDPTLDKGREIARFTCYLLPVGETPSIF